MSTLARRMGYGRSLLERLYANNVPMQMLNEQHRMHKEISQYPSAAFYGGMVSEDWCKSIL